MVGGIGKMMSAIFPQETRLARNVAERPMVVLAAEFQLEKETRSFRDVAP